MTTEPRNTSRRRRLALVLGLVCSCALVATVWWLQRDARDVVRSPATSPPSAGDRRAAAAEKPPSVPSEAQLALERRWDELVARAAAAAATGGEAARHFVQTLFAELDARSPAERREAILAFFGSGRDVRLGRAFVVGPGGYLRDWPTLRVALFDYLSQRDGEAARALAGQLLQTRPDEAGEWTVALRELARGKTADQWTPLVTARVHDLVDDNNWAEAGEPSWLEGFDLIVAGKSPAFLPDLSAVASSAPSRAARFAGFLAADRLMLAAPVDTLVALNASPTLFVDEPNVRAGLFARADVRQPAQLRELETYLVRDDVSASERVDFASLFPLYDMAVSNNLLSTAASRPMSDLLAHDQATLGLIEHWLDDPAFAPSHAGLLQVANRLRGQVALAERKTPGM